MIAEAKPEAKEVLQTITFFNYSGILIPCLDGNRFDRQSVLMTGPDRFMESAWINLSRAPAGIGFYFSSYLEPFIEGCDPYINSPETYEAIAEFSRDVLEPYGAMIRKLKSSPRKAAALDSLASRVYGEAPKMHTHYSNYQIYNFYTVMNMAQIPTDVVFDETLMKEGALDDYELLALPVCDNLPKAVYNEILRFVERGGIVIADQYLNADIPGVIKFDFDFTYRKNVNANANYSGKDFAVKDDTAFRKDWKMQEIKGVGAEEDQKIMESYAVELRKTLEGKFERNYDCETPTALLNMLEYGSAKYLMVVNDKRIYGERVGKYKSMLEKGVPQIVEINISDLDENTAIYDILERKKLTLSKKNGENCLKLQLPSSGGKILAIYPQSIETIEIQAPDNIALPGENVSIRILLLDDEGKKLDGLLPLNVEFISPDGNINDFSNYYTAVDGVCRLDFIPAANDVDGKWKILVTELCSGKKKTFSFDVHLKNII